MGTFRERDNESHRIGTWYREYDGASAVSDMKDLDEHCEDFVGNIKKDNPFTLQRCSVQGGGITGQASGLLKYHFDNWPATRCRNLGLPSPVSSAYADNLKATALARTGISAPIVNLPLFVVELKDIPRMLKHAGDLLHHWSSLQNKADLLTARPSRRAPVYYGDPAQGAAAATLAWQFGWAPLIQDLEKLFNFSEAVEKRRRQINDAHTRQGGYKGQSILEKNSSKSSSSKKINSSKGVNYTAIETSVSTTESWATVHWTPRSSISRHGHSHNHVSAFRSALGLTARNIPLTVWKALPWSWLFDWFANISEYIQAIDNSIDYRPSKGCIMVHKTTTISWPGTQVETSGWNNYYIDPYIGFQETKQRFVYSTFGLVFPTMKLPFLDNFKLSVLGSLTILKIRKLT